MEVRLRRLPKCWWRKDSAVIISQAQKNLYAELAAVVCAYSIMDPRIRNLPEKNWKSPIWECWNPFVGCCFEGDWCLLRKENYHHRHHQTKKNTMYNSSVLGGRQYQGITSLTVLIIYISLKVDKNNFNNWASKSVKQIGYFRIFRILGAPPCKFNKIWKDLHIVYSICDFPQSIKYFLINSYVKYISNNSKHMSNGYNNLNSW